MVHSKNKASDLIKKISLWTIVVLVFLIPWVFSTDTEEYYEISKNIILLYAVSILSLLWIASIVISKKTAFLRTPIDLAIIFFFIASLISTIFSLSVDTSLWGYHMRINGGLISYILLFLLFYGTINNIKDKQTVKFIITSITYSLGIFALFTVLKGINFFTPILSKLAETNSDMNYIINPLFTPAGNPNSLTALFLIGLPFSIFTLLNKKQNSTLGQVSGFIISLILIWAISITSIANSIDFAKFTNWLIALLLVVFGILFSLKTRKSNPRGMIFNILLLIFLIFGFVYSNNYSIRGSITPTLNFTRYYDIPAESSLEVIKGTVNKYSLKSIVTGTGLDTYAYIFPQFRPESQNIQPNWFENYTRSNTQIESIITSNGLIGLAAFLFFSFSLIKFLVKKIIAQKVFNKSANLMALSLVSFIFVFSFFTTYHSSTFLIISWISIGLLFSLFSLYFKDANAEFVFDLKLTGKNSKKEKNIAPYLFGGSLLIITVTLLFFTTVNHRAEVFFSESLKLASDGNYDSAYDKLIQAINLNNQRDYYHKEVSTVGLSKLEALITTTQNSTTTLTDEDKQKLAVTQQYLETLINSEINKSIVLNSDSSDNWQRASVIYKRLTELSKGQKYGSETLQSIQQAISKNPNNPDNYLLLGFIYQYNSDEKLRDLAEEAYTKAYTLQPSYALSIIQLGQYLESTKQYDLALSLYKVSKEQIYKDESEFNKFLSERINATQKAIESNKEGN